MRSITSLLVALLWASSALAQATLQQGGSTTQGHAPAYWSSGSQQPIVIDSGPAGGNTTGQGLSELNITARGTGTAPFAGQGTGQGGTVFQIQDAVSTNAGGYHYLSMSANANGGGLISYGAIGAAATLPLTFRVNGTDYQFPFSNGFVVGPGSSTIGHVACWNNTAGTLLSDCGSLLTIGGTNGQIQYNNSGALGGFTLGGDATVNTGTGALTVTKLGGVSATLGGALSTAGTFTTAGNVTHAGAFNQTFTGTGNFNVTFPVGSSTMASLAGTEALTNKTYNGLTINSTTGTLAITNGKTLTASNTLQFSGTDGSTLNVGTGGTLGTAAYTAASAYVPSNTQLTNSRATDVAMGAAGTYANGPIVAQGSSGTWYASGTITVSCTGGADDIYVRLYDGSNILASTSGYFALATHPISISISGSQVSPSGSIRIQAASATRSDCSILANSSGNSKDSTITAFRVN